MADIDVEDWKKHTDYVSPCSPSQRWTARSSLHPFPSAWLQPFGRGRGLVLEVCRCMARGAKGRYPRSLVFCTPHAPLADHPSLRLVRTSPACCNSPPERRVSLSTASRTCKAPTVLGDSRSRRRARSGSCPRVTPASTGQCSFSLSSSLAESSRADSSNRAVSQDRPATLQKLRGPRAEAHHRRRGDPRLRTGVITRPDSFSSFSILLLSCARPDSPSLLSPSSLHSSLPSLAELPYPQRSLPGSPLYFFLFLNLSLFSLPLSPSPFSFVSSPRAQPRCPYILSSVR